MTKPPPPLKILDEHGEVIAVEVTLGWLEKALYPTVVARCSDIVNGIVEEQDNV